MRKLIRPTLGKQRRLPPSVPARRAAPPAATNAEASYLQQAIESRGTLVVRLGGGAELRGRLEFHDRDCLGLQREGQPVLLVRKRKVKYFWLERPAT